jgi:predicted dienelactone hydrolase
MVRASVWVFLISLLPAAALAQSPVGAIERRFVPPEPYDWRGAKTHALDTTIWYPAADAKMTEHDIGPPGAPLFRLGSWADDAKPAVGRHPLIVFSHGTGGSAAIMSWFGRALAARGYIVAGVNHPGNNALEEYTVEGFSLWWKRAPDLTTVIDNVLRDEVIGPAIDPARIGAAGFSLGGYTMFELAGARTDPTLYLKFCAIAGGCIDPPEFPNLTARRNELEKTSQAFRDQLAQSGQSYRDPRVRAVFAIAPALGPAFVPDSLRAIKIPVAIVTGDTDPLLPLAANAQALAKQVPGASLTIVPGGVGHYTFLAICTDAGRKAQAQLCTDNAGVDRAAVHQRAVDLASAFFERTLK